MYYSLGSHKGDACVSLFYSSWKAVRHSLSVSCFKCCARGTCNHAAHSFESEHYGSTVVAFRHTPLCLLISCNKTDYGVFGRSESDAELASWWDVVAQRLHHGHCWNSHSFRSRLVGYTCSNYCGWTVVFETGLFLRKCLFGPDIPSMLHVQPSNSRRRHRMSSALVSIFFDSYQFS